MQLSNNQQAILMFLAFFLPPLGTWFALGYPTDHAAVGILAASVVSGLIAYIKEISGSAAPTTTVKPA